MDSWFVGKVEMKKIIEFIQESISEFKKVQWPTKEQTVRLTGIVIGVSLIIGLYVSGVDYLFKELIASILK